MSKPTARPELPVATDHIETGTTQLIAGLANGVLTLTLNRPEVRNALTREMLEALSHQLAEAETADAVKCVVVTGAGMGFCAGGDVKRMAAKDDPNPAMTEIDCAIHGQRILQRNTAGRLFRMPKPTIAVINGAAAGAGLSLAMACDLRIMASTAILTTAFAKVGLSGDYGGTYFMTQLIGASKARELYFLSDRIDAGEAVRLGLVTQSCSPQTLAETGATLARRLANGPTVAYRYMKENLNRAIAGEMDDCLDTEATHHVHTMLTSDHREAVAAFVRKREPAFNGI